MYLRAFIFLALLVLMCAIPFIWDAPMYAAEEILGQHILYAALVFVGILVLATVIAPITVLPVVPMVAPVFGPFLTGVLSILGWTIGALIAFLLARHAGKPLLGKYISLSSIEVYEQYLPSEVRFLTIVMLRILVPVDVLSYTLGLFSTISVLQYTIATAIGVSWFSFAFAYLGVAAFEKNIYLFATIGVLSLVVLGLSARYVLQQVLKQKSKTEQ